MRFVFILVTLSVAFSFPESENIHVRRRATVQQKEDSTRPAATRAESDAYWASYLQSLESVPSQPTQAPSASPTNDCEVDVVLNCTYVSPETGDTLLCEDLDAIDTTHCTCPDCATGLLFTYTGKSCNGFEECTDGETAPGSSAVINFFPCDVTVPALTQTVTAGESITIALGDDVCLPDCMDVTVTDAVTGMEEQSLRINTSCDDRGLKLKDSYGAIDFIGYTCAPDDINNCFQDVVYDVAACNPGDIDFMLFDFIFFFDGETTDFLDGLRPIVGPGQCYAKVMDEVIDICIAGEYIANATARATNNIPETSP